MSTDTSCRTEDSGWEWWVEVGVCGVETCSGSVGRSRAEAGQGSGGGEVPSEASVPEPECCPGEGASP